MNRYLRRLRSQKRPVRFLLSRLFWKTRLSNWLRIRKEDYLLRFYPSSLSASLWVDSHDRLADEQFFRSYLRPGDVVIDIGANIGHLSLLSSKEVGGCGRVVAVEAHPKIFRYLKGNIALNQARNIEAHNVALGDREGSAIFSDKKSDDQNSVLTVESGIRVPMRRIDSLGLNCARVNLMKIDVEGYEKFVLEGASTLLEKTECVYFESWMEHFARYGYDCKEVLDLFSQKRFQVCKLDGHQLIPLSPDYISEQCENLVAIKDPKEFERRTGARFIIGNNNHIAGQSLSLFRL